MANTLTELVCVRFFAGDREERERIRAAYPGRWPTDADFIRAACKSYARYFNTVIKD